MIRDKNSFKFTAVDAPKRQVVSYPIHRLMFQAAFASNFKHAEKQVESENRFYLRSSSRVVEMFGVAAAIKANSSLDWSLLLPQCYCLEGHEGLTERGDIVFPIEEENEDVVKVFLPGGVDEDGCSKVSLDAILNVSIEEMLPHLPEKMVEGYAISVEKGSEHASVRSENPMMEGDFLIIRRKPYKIRAISDDDAFSAVEGSRNIIRVQKKFLNNVTAQKLRYKRIPSFYGSVVSLPKVVLADHKVVSFDFIANRNGNKHGLMHINYFNTIFNQLGYMVHDRAVHLDSGDVA